MSLSINIQPYINNPTVANNILSFLQNDDVARAAEVSTVFRQTISDYNNQSLSYNRRISPSVTFDANLRENELRLPNGFTARIPNDQIIRLPNNHITKKSFIEDPLFKDTKEKENVFNELAKITKEDSFFERYMNFLSILDRSDWFRVCEEDPIRSSYLSILAFFDGKINVGELFSIHSVAMAYKNLKEGRINADEVDIVDVQPIVLETDELVEYLKEPFFDFDHDFEFDFDPDFDFDPSSIPDRILKNRKIDPSQLENAKAKFLSKAHGKSHVERTFLELTLSPLTSPYLKNFKLDRTDFRDLSMFTAARYKSKSKVGFKGIELGIVDNALKDKGVAVLPPVGLTVDLLQSVIGFGPKREVIKKLQEPMLMFGHANRYNVLFGGRPITGASPLFKVMGPHGSRAELEELSMLFHDLCYHLFVAANIPHVKLLKEIGMKLLEANFSEFSKSEKKYLRRFAGEILDMDGVAYRRIFPSDAFWGFLMHKLKELKGWGISLDSFNKYLEKIFHPQVNEILQKYSVTKNQIPITEKTLDELSSGISGEYIY